MSKSTSVISSTCEQYVRRGQCGKPVAWLYPARVGGWMALCEQCATPHKGTKFKFLYSIRELIEAGVTFCPPLAIDVAMSAEEKK